MPRKRRFLLGDSVDRIQRRKTHMKKKCKSIFIKGWQRVGEGVRHRMLKSLVYSMTRARGKSKMGKVEG